MNEPLLVRTLRGNPGSQPPVWFMRQAGSHFEEHEAMFREHGVRGITTNPERNSRVTLLPVEKLDVDAAVMYADIILPLEDIGVEFHYGEGETGPIIHNPIEEPGDVEVLRPLDPHRGVPYILEAIENVRGELDSEKALIGFSGGPFTLAGYMIEGEASRHFPDTKRFMHTHPEAFHELMTLLSESIIGYLEAQVEAGIDVIQLFDSWIGVLSPADYRQYVKPYHEQIFERLASLDPPTIQFGTNTSGFLKDYLDVGSDAYSIDWRMEWDRVVEAVGHHFIVQGNLDPSLLFGPEETLKEEVRAVIQGAEPFDGHVFNLGHRIPLNVSTDKLRTVVDTVREAGD
jgi:uroporphyrinogen decarboxylase